jgi:uncharacterized protein
VRLENAFEVPAGPERAWELLMDVPRVIPCMPGAELTETVDDATWKATMKVKFGPMSFAFATDVRHEEVDATARRAVISARAREMRGRGGGQATIESRLAAVNGGTRVEIVTDLTLSGAVAQFGRGMVEDVSAQMVNGFAECLKAELSQPEEGEPPRDAPRPQPAEAVSGLPLVLGALRRAVSRIFRRRKP